jgi:hypothetical protein
MSYFRMSFISSSQQSFLQQVRQQIDVQGLDQALRDMQKEPDARIMEVQVRLIRLNRSHTNNEHIIDMYA